MSLFKVIPRFLKIALVTVAGVMVLVFFFISPILEYVVEKYSKKWTGRYILMEDLDLNILTGKLEFDNIKILEADDKTTFFSCKNLLVDFTLYRLIAGDYYISKLALQQPFARVVRSVNGFNFDDLIKESSPEEEKKDTAEIHYQVRNISIDQGVVDYINSDFENKITVSALKISTEKIAWDDVKTLLDYSFSLNDGGKVSGNFLYDHTSGKYYVKTLADQLSLKRLNPYIKDFYKIDDFNGYMNCDLSIRGNSSESTDLVLKGDFRLSDLLFTAPGKDSLVALKNFSLGIDSVNFKDNIFLLRSVSISGLYALFEQYADSTNNFDRLAKVDSTAVASGDSAATMESASSNHFLLIADFVKQIAHSYDMNSYQVDSFYFGQAKIVYNDYSMLESFKYHLTNLEVASNTLDSKLDRVEITSRADLNYTGNFEAWLSFNPKDYMEMDLKYKISDVLLTDMSPHSVHYLAYPFMEGVANYECNSSIRNMQLKSSNNVLITKVNVGNKVKSKTAMDIPFKLAVALLRDVKGNIDLSVPVEGDLNDPDYRIGKVILQVLYNILIKAVTSPYRIIAHAVSVDENDIRQIRFNYLDTTFTNKQFKSVDQVAKVLEKKPELSVRFVQFTNYDREAERYASFESRKQYLNENGQSISDSLTKVQMDSVDTFTILDSSFVKWIDEKFAQQEVNTPVQQKILKLTGEEKIKEAVSGFVIKREQALKDYIVASGLDTSRFQVMTEVPEKIPASEPLPQIHIYFDVKE